MFSKHLDIIALCVFCLSIGLCDAALKIEYRNSNHSSRLWDRDHDIEKNETLKNNYINDANKLRLQRLGYSTGYGGLSGFSGTGISGYNPVKLDLGGVVIGTLVGIGAVLIIPKLLGILHGGYVGSHYARSDGETDMNSMTNLFNKLDTLLIQNKIDSTSCIQLAVCKYIRSTDKTAESDAVDPLDNMAHNLLNNSFVDSMLEGTAIKEAFDTGHDIYGKDCNEKYSSCPLDAKAAANILNSVIFEKS